MEEIKLRNKRGRSLDTVIAALDHKAANRWQLRQVWRNGNRRRTSATINNGCVAGRVVLVKVFRSERHCSVEHQILIVRASSHLNNIGWLSSIDSRLNCGVIIWDS